MKSVEDFEINYWVGHVYSLENRVVLTQISKNWITATQVLGNGRS